MEELHATMEILLMEMDEVLLVLLNFLDHQCGSVQVEMLKHQIFATSGEEMDLDMKTHGNIIQEEIYSDSKK